MADVAKIEAARAPVTTSPVDLIRTAVEKGMDAQFLSTLVDLQERMEKNVSEKAFNEAMGKAQSEMTAVAADMTNSQTRSKYASYAALDRALRPIYTAHGFSISFDTADAADEFVRVLAYVAHSDGYTRTYRVDMPADGKGAKGNDVMTKTHAAGAAMSYGMRYLLKMIFNVAVGEDDRDGNLPSAFISAAQKDQIIALMRETNTDTAQFLTYLRIGTLDQLPAAKFNAAIAALNGKKARK